MSSNFLRTYTSCSHAMTVAKNMADTIRCRIPASSCLSMSFLFHNLCYFNLRAIYISCKANSISHKCQGIVKEGQKLESNDLLPNDQLSPERSLDTCKGNGNCGTIFFYLKLHICIYLIGDRGSDLTLPLLT